MTACCHTARWPLGITSEYDSGISDVAGRVQQRLKESVEHYLEPRLDQLASEIADIYIENRGANVPVDRETAHAAFRFASWLPRSVPLPEVSSDPDGEICFDWFGPSGEMFSVSVDRSGKLSYAGWFREDSRIHGTETMVDGLPGEIVRALQRATRQAIFSNRSRS